MNNAWQACQPVRRWTVALLLAGLLPGCGGGGSDTPDTDTPTAIPQGAHLRPGLGVISYWGSSAAPYQRLPSASLAVLNPQVGVLAPGSTTMPVASLATWQLRSAELRARGVRHLGYVPTGYLRHDCDVVGVCQTWTRIEAQIATYLTQMPELDGLFFDETAPTTWDCKVFAGEYARLRALVTKHRRAGAPAPMLVFNPGIADPCVLDGLDAGETVVVFEGTAASHAERETVLTEVTRQARQRGLQTWHLVHTASTSAALQSVVARARQADTTWLGVTSTGGQWQINENTWGAPPPFWNELVQLLAAP